MNPAHAILVEEFATIDGLRELYLVPEAGNTFVIWAKGDQAQRAEGFEAFVRAADRIVIEAPGSPTFIWGDVVDIGPEGSEVISL